MRLDGMNAVALLVVAVCIAALHGCAGTMPGAEEPTPRQTTERVLMIGHAALDALVLVVRPVVAEGMRSCEDDACRERWATASGAYDATRAAFDAVRDAYQAYSESADGEADWLGSLACARSSAAHLIVALGEVGVDVPGPIVSAIESIGIYLGTCPDA